MRSTEYSPYVACILFVHWVYDVTVATARGARQQRRCAVGCAPGNHRRGLGRVQYAHRLRGRRTGLR
eukprot:128751-Pleurochrysis_carterae.AAC.1